MIRKYESHDFQELFDLLHDVYQTNIDKETLENNYINDFKSILVAVDDETGKLLGCTFIEELKDLIRPNKILYVTYVAVDERFRHQGIGKKLMHEVEKKCRELGCSAIELTSANYRKNAHLFYEALGFTKKKTTLFIKEID